MTKYFHISPAVNRTEILRHGLRAHRGWQSNSAVYLTTNPTGWLFMFENGGIYETTAVDIYQIGTRGLSLLPDTNETATPGEDWFVKQSIPPERVRWKERLGRTPSGYVWATMDVL